jgi:hypothetical protein
MRNRELVPTFISIPQEGMETNQKRQARASPGWGKRSSDLIIPNPKLKLMDQVREVEEVDG